MTATYTLNADLNEIEITFPGKPAQNIIDSLKAVGYRWHKVKALWYAKRSPETLALAQSIADGETPAAKPESKPALPMDTPESQAAYESAIRTYYTKPETAAFYLNNSRHHTVLLPSGIVFTISKPEIEKDFCFGYSSCGQGPEHSEAIKAADKARESEEYFLRENMRYFTDTIAELDARNEFFPIEFRIYLPVFQVTKMQNIMTFHVMPPHEINRLGLTWYNHAGERQHSDWSNTDYYIPTDEEIAIIRACYEEAGRQHEKRVRAYLKRYGLSKLHVWTYWLDD